VDIVEKLKTNILRSSYAKLKSLEAKLKKITTLLYGMKVNLHWQDITTVGVKAADKQWHVLAWWEPWGTVVLTEQEFAR
jgi:hypothetical protein